MQEADEVIGMPGSGPLADRISAIEQTLGLTAP
jgi:hypothetical protein